MNKKHACLLKRFAALVAALIVCSSFCVPAFASNNASTFEWVVIDKRDFLGENGTLTPYLHLSPYVNGEVYAATFETRFLSYLGSYYQGDSVTGSSYAHCPQVWGCPVNYPDWWRADLPLGRRALVQFDKLTFISSGSSSLFSNLTSVSFLPQNKVYSFDITADQVIQKQQSLNPDVYLSGKFPFYLISTYSQTTNNDVNDNYVGGNHLCLGGLPVSYNASSPVIHETSAFQCVLTLNQNNLHYSYCLIDTMANASLSQIEWLVMPNICDWSDEQKLQLNDKILKVSAEVSFWIDASKLPSGLEIGDSFPAPDQFDSLRDSLLDDYDVDSKMDETKNNLDSFINDFESVDSSVGSSASSFLSSIFNSFGFVILPLFIMLLGAGILRIVLRKAVS